MSALRKRTDKEHAQLRLSINDDSYILDDIPADVLNSKRKISKSDIDYICNEVLDWEELARLLPEEPISTEELREIKQGHHRDRRSSARDVLMLWRQKCHESATVGSLAESLHLLGYSQVAMALKP
ncbi:uncharacterized protein LOC135377736 [Ornithodoros turicata]|uniref:uncharacterized protein LOC135377736 n=1 Tax=Ornithodoros turicata TaxID=34597 RepID=UPI003138E54B